MHPEGGEVHIKIGNEVWVYDLKISSGKVGLLLKTGDYRWAHRVPVKQIFIVTNTDMAIDVYGLPGGEYIRSLLLGSTPFVVGGLMVTDERWIYGLD